MKLNSRQCRLIRALEFGALKPVSAVAKQIGMRESSASYALRRLKNSGTLREGVIINFFALGYQLITVFFSLRTRAPVMRAKFLKMLCAKQGVAWVGTLAGDYQYGAALLVKNMSDVFTMLESVTQASGAAIFEKAILPRLSLSFLNNPLDDAVQHQRQHITISQDAKVETIDELDHGILQLLSAGAYESLRAIAIKLKAPLTTIARRIDKLKESGIIAAFVLRINEEHLGLQSYRLLIEVPGIEPRLRKQIREYWIKQPAATLVMESLGPWDFEVDVAVSSQPQLIAIRDQLSDLVGGELTRIKILSEIEDLSYSLYPFKERISPV